MGYYSTFKTTRNRSDINEMVRIEQNLCDGETDFLVRANLRMANVKDYILEEHQEMKDLLRERITKDIQETRETKMCWSKGTLAQRL
jgi:hypothetical protein